jgi:hypothetical protein
MFVVAAPNAAKSRRVQMNLDARDIFEAVTVLLRRGYDHEYRTRKGQLYDLTADKPRRRRRRSRGWHDEVRERARCGGRLKHLRDR